ncbi:lipoprotein [Citrobacter koseri]|uniref:Lipoprotein n=1 Tax=Citrobacter koseri TaxID=545 RepID=A0A2X2WPF4_CITKO|nr:lipoprotein [Citrobacter koseri]
MAISCSSVPRVAVPADHVGVYVGNGKFIQSPRSGQEIQITSLSEDYWQRHYVGARRVMTPKTIR